MTTVAIIQARMGSSRLPGKVLADVAGRPLLAWVIDRARAVAGVDRVVVATTTEPADEPVSALARAMGVDAFAGSRDDVLDRYYQAAKCHRASVIVRLTGDCPLLDSAVSARVLSRFTAFYCDYASNVHPPSFPDGLDTEVMSIAALERAWTEARLPSEREHVTPYLWKHPDRFHQVNIRNAQDLSHHRWTVDESRDLEFVRCVYDDLVKSATTFGTDEILNLLARRPDILRLNEGRIRDAGYAISLQREADTPRSVGSLARE